jgi:hypothetical protein
MKKEVLSLFITLSAEDEKVFFFLFLMVNNNIFHTRSWHCESISTYFQRMPITAIFTVTACLSYDLTTVVLCGGLESFRFYF